MSLRDETGPVASPVAASPTRALVEEFVTILEGSLQLTFRLVLDPCLPLMADQPAGNEVVVIGVENPLPPFFILKSVEEVMTREDFRAISACPARHA
jgi:hypothetical protein